MRKESKEMAVTAATMKIEKRNEPAATTFVNYLESWYQNKCLSNSTSSSTAAYYYWMIFNVIEPNLPDKERAVDDIDAEYLNALLARIDRKNENMAAQAKTDSGLENYQSYFRSYLWSKKCNGRIQSSY